MEKIISNFISLILLSIGLNILWGVWRASNGKSVSPFFDKLKEDEANLSDLDDIQLSIYRAETLPNYHVDPITDKLVADCIHSNVQINDNMTIISEEHRHELTQKLSGTHMAKLARFAHAVTDDGKLVITADAVDYLSKEYDTILLPGGLVRIHVTNEIEASLFAAMTIGQAVFIQNKDTGLIQKVDFDKLKQCVHIGSIEELIARNKFLEASLADFKQM